MKLKEVIRSQGYGLDEEERNQDVFCIGAPVFGVKNEVIACISISGPKSRFTKQNMNTWLKAVIETANEASDFLKGKK